MSSCARGRDRHAAAFIIRADAAYLSLMVPLTTEVRGRTAWRRGVIAALTVTRLSFHPVDHRQTAREKGSQGFMALRSHPLSVVCFQPLDVFLTTSSFSSDAPPTFSFLVTTPPHTGNKLCCCCFKLILIVIIMFYVVSSRVNTHCVRKSCQTAGNIK